MAGGGIILVHFSFLVQKVLLFFKEQVSSGHPQPTVYPILVFGQTNWPPDTFSCVYVHHMITWPSPFGSWQSFLILLAISQVSSTNQCQHVSGVSSMLVISTHRLTVSIAKCLLLKKACQYHKVWLRHVAQLHPTWLDIPPPSLNIPEYMNMQICFLEGDLKGICVIYILFQLVPAFY